MEIIMETKIHKSGFVNIVGNPNVGKSTLTNALMKEKLSIVNSKPQTTRHRIFGIISEDDYQVIISDSPGIIMLPAYGLQKKMNDFAYSSFEDADIVLFVMDIFTMYEGTEPIFDQLRKTTTPKFLIINKVDLDNQDRAQGILETMQKLLPFEKVFLLSAMNKEGTDELMTAIIDTLPEGPEYYPKDQLTDRPERFFVSEIIRGNILSQYKQEIPYSCEVVVDQFKNMEARSGPMLNIMATIFVDRKTQKAIIIGHKGEAIKNLGIASRLEIEAFFEQKVHLELYVAIKENWRNSDNYLKGFGYV
jgi:GTPase